MTHRKDSAMLLSNVVVLACLTGCGSPTFEKPRPERPIQLPSDHGAHPSFKTEWWYLERSPADRRAATT